MKKSVFDPHYQNINLEYRIVASMKRIAEAFRVLLWKETKHTDLIPIQVQPLIFILFQSGDHATITHLAKESNMTKATVSDSVKVLEQKKLVYRSYSPADKRSFTIALTKYGTEIA